MKNDDAIKFVKEVAGMSLDWDDNHYEALQLAIEALSDRPTGEWRGEHKMPDMPRYEWYRCSECNSLSQSVVNYCPHCGAYMKGKVM